MSDNENKFRDCHTDHIQRDQRLPRPAAPAVSQMGPVLPYHPFGCNQNRVQENGYTILLFLGWNNSCWAGVEAESELESESIFSGRSRSWSRSRLKFVDSAALPLGVIIINPNLTLPTTYRYHLQYHLQHSYPPPPSWKGIVCMKAHATSAPE